MATDFDPALLRATYDRGRLVPFIGSGMSRPLCTDWRGFVAGLERKAGIRIHPHSRHHATEKLTERALDALQLLRQRGVPVSQAISESIYCRDVASIPENTLALAETYWGLVCTTNYDDVYLRARASVWRDQKEREGKTDINARQWPSIRVLGRSEDDCRFVLQNLAFPVQQCLWALQGFLAPTTEDSRRIVDATLQPPDLLESELVVGHSEYRKVSYRAPHFRRAFAELYRTRTFLFLGSGLTEEYFRALFDEIIELSGPPIRPHHAFIEEGTLDADFMQREYHIICHCYPARKHETVTQWLRLLSKYLQGSRVRGAEWCFRSSGAKPLGSACVEREFRVSTADVPRQAQVPGNEAVAISLGRKGAGSSQMVPLASGRGRRMVGVDEQAEPIWEKDYIVRWKGEGLDRSFGIVARALGGAGRQSREIGAISKSFLAFLKFAGQSGFKAVHVQLLAAGGKRAFAAWVSLVQMARAYGEWLQQASEADSLLRVHVYVSHPGVIALLQGGFIDLTESLENGALRLTMVVLYAEGAGTRNHELVHPDAALGTLKELQEAGESAWAEAIPKPRLNAQPMLSNKAARMSFRDFGLVSGSTLLIDFRPGKRSPTGAASLS